MLVTKQRTLPNGNTVVRYIKLATRVSGPKKNRKIVITCDKTDFFHFLICYVKSSTLSNERKNKWALPPSALLALFALWHHMGVPTFFSPIRFESTPGHPTSDVKDQTPKITFANGIISVRKCSLFLRDVSVNRFGMRGNVDFKLKLGFT